MWTGKELPWDVTRDSDTGERLVPEGGWARPELLSYAVKRADAWQKQCSQQVTSFNGSRVVECDTVAPLCAFLVLQGSLHRLGLACQASQDLGCAADLTTSTTRRICAVQRVPEFLQEWVARALSEQPGWRPDYSLYSLLLAEAEITAGDNCRMEE